MTTLAAILALASSADAELSLFVFADGLPVKGAEVRVGEQIFETDDAGSLFTAIPSGERLVVVVVENTEEVARQAITPGPGEAIRLMVNAGEGTTIERSGEGVEPAIGVGATVATGVIAGRVTEAESGEALNDARVYVSGATQPTRTDEDGRFRLSVVAGTHALSVLASGYETTTREGVVVEADVEVAVELELTPRGIELAEWVVTAPHVEGSLASVFDTRRESAQVLEVLGAEQMSRAGDSDAAAALKRVTGLTVVGGRYVYVRGLGERYSTTLLNGALLPSPDPTRRVVPLDLFPVDVLRGVEVQKTFDPSMPGDFSGGAITLRTRGIPEEGFVRLGVSLGANTQTTGRRGQTYQGGGRDYLGMDDGTRALPRQVRDASDNGRIPINKLDDDERERAGESFPNIYNTTDSTQMANLGLQIGAGQRFGNDERHVGYLVAATYGNNRSRRSEERARLALDGDGGVTPFQTGDLDRTEQSIDLGGVVNVAGQINPDHRFEAVGLVARRTDNGVLFLEDYLTSDNRDQRTTTLEWIEKEILSAQLRGEHVFASLAELGVTWQATWASATRDEPDAREYRYARRRFPGIDPDPFELAATTSLGRNPVSRSYESLSDDLQSYALNASLPLSVGGLGLTIRVGGSHTRIDRDADVYRYRFDLPSPAPPQLDAMLGDGMETILAADNIGPEQWQLSNASQGSDSYTGTHGTWAGYGAATVAIGDRIDVSGGARVEDSAIVVRTSELINPEQVDRARLDGVDVMPAANATWHLNETMQVRGAFSSTVNRPQLKELSPVPFTDPDTRFVRIGNPNLQQASIQSFDLRYEWYWAGTEGLSMAGFYKRFTDPIERVVVGGGPNGEGVRQYANVEGADNLGVELEGRFSLRRFHRWLAPFTVATNISLIRSQVTIGAEDAQLLTSTDRPLQGQSPWVVNAQLEYGDEDLGVEAALLFNLWGARIFDVGIKGLPDAYEQGTALLDLVVAYTVTDAAAIKLKAKNLLNSEVEVTQGGGTLRRYRRGMSFSLGFSYRFAI